MERNVTNLYNEAKENKEFQGELKVHEPELYQPSVLWSEQKKVLYALIYMGWLIGKGLYNESKYL